MSLPTNKIEVEDAYHPLGSKAFIDITIICDGKRYNGLLHIEDVEKKK